MGAVSSNCVRSGLVYMASQGSKQSAFEKVCPSIVARSGDIYGVAHVFTGVMSVGGGVVG